MPERAGTDQDGADPMRERVRLLVEEGRRAERAARREEARECYERALRALNRAHRLFGDLRARHRLADVDRRLRSLEEDFLRIVREWGESLESKDTYTQGHCEWVAEYACRLARAAGFPEEYLVWFRKFPWDVRPMIRGHHERWDGTGYPRGEEGKEIHRSARILCIADVYDALTTGRAYRSAYSPEAALAILRKEAGSAFDPDLVELFVTLAETDELSRAEAGSRSFEANRGTGTGIGADPELGRFAPSSAAGPSGAPAGAAA
ncbi:MAG: HD-GYP domain-containing protein [Gemmatimonadota bacterium]